MCNYFLGVHNTQQEADKGLTPNIVLIAGLKILTINLLHYILKIIFLKIIFLKKIFLKIILLKELIGESYE